MTRRKSPGSNQRGARHGHVLGGQHIDKPFVDRRVKSRSVPCPTCGAGIDVDCTSANGKPVSHATRRRMALRKEREEQEK